MKNYNNNSYETRLISQCVQSAYYPSRLRQTLLSNHSLLIKISSAQQLIVSKLLGVVRLRDSIALEKSFKQGLSVVGRSLGLVSTYYFKEKICLRYYR